MTVVGNPEMGKNAPKAMWLLLLVTWIIWFIVWALPEALHG